MIVLRALTLSNPFTLTFGRIIWNGAAVAWSTGPVVAEYSAVVSLSILSSLQMQSCLRLASLPVPLLRTCEMMKGLRDHRGASLSPFRAFRLALFRRTLSPTFMFVVQDSRRSTSFVEGGRQRCSSSPLCEIRTWAPTVQRGSRVPLGPTSGHAVFP